MPLIPWKMPGRGFKSKLILSGFSLKEQEMMMVSNYYPSKKEPSIWPSKQGSLWLPQFFSPLSSVFDVKQLVWKGGSFRMVVLPPFSTEGLSTSDVDSFMARINVEMQKTLDELTKEAKKHKQLPSDK